MQPRETAPPHEIANTAMSFPPGDGAAASISQQRVLSKIRSLGGRASAAGLAKELGLHVTTVRNHLTALEESGMVTAIPVAERRRGRPTLEYVVVLDAVRDAQGALLSAFAESAVGKPELIEQIGQKMADWIESITASGPENSAGTNGAARSDGPLERLHGVFLMLGFHPLRVGDSLTLRTCPFLDAATDHPEVICQIHAAVAQRLANADGLPGVQVNLAPFASPQGMCQLTIREP